MREFAWRVGASAVVLLVAAAACAEPAWARAADAVTCPVISGGVATPAPANGVDWAGCDLSGIDLNYTDLSGVTFTGADLTGAQLGHAAIANSDLSDVNLTGASPNAASITNSDLSGADLANLGFNQVNLTGDNLTGATLTNADFSYTTLTRTNLTGVDLSTALLAAVSSGGVTGQVKLPAGWELVNGWLLGTNANLTGAVLAKADLSGLDLTFATLVNANLSGANIAGTQLGRANISGIKSGGLTGKPATFPSGYTIVDGYILGQAVNLDGMTLTSLPLAGVNLSYASMKGADLAGMNLTATQLASADLTGANLASAVLDHAALTAATLTGANLAKASAVGADFSTVSAARADLAGANLMQADLFRANLAKANLTGAVTASATVSQAKLAGAILTGLRSGTLSGAPATVPAGWSVIGGYLVGPHASLEGARFGGVFAVNDSFVNADLAGASFAGATLRSTDFRGANLTGARLAGADLTGAALTATNAKLAKASWSKSTICPNGHPAAATGCFAKPAVAHPPAIRLTVRRGAPGTAVAVYGTGYAKSEALTIAFGPAVVAKAKTTSAGAFGPVTIAAPASAKPGLHQITVANAKVKGQSAAGWFTIATDWAQPSFGPGLTGFNPAENTLTPAKAPVLTSKFTVSTGGQESRTPAIDDGVAFVSASNGPLTAFNAVTGKRLWSWDATGTAALSAPVVANGTAYVSVAETGIVAIAPGGTLLWQSHANVLSGSSAISLSQPTLAGGVLYATENQDVFAFDAASGTQLWHTVPTPWKSVSPQNCGSPAYSARVLYLACTNGYVYALSAANGTTLWYTEIPGDPGFVHAAVSGGTLYATTGYDSDALYAISLAAHATLWTFTGSTIVNQPAVAGGTVYAQVANELYALNAATGNQVWSFKLTDSGLIDPFPPAVGDGVVYAVSVDEVAYAINAKTGSKLWSYRAGNTLQSPPVISDGRLYIGTGTGGLAAFGA